METIERVRKQLGEGLVIPACPLALTAQRKFAPIPQRALIRYYFAAGAGGIAVGVHTTQFAIRHPKIGLFRPVLEIAANELRGGTQIGIAGICGETLQAVAEAELIRELGFHAGLLSLGALKNASEDRLIAHCRTIAQIIPLIGFYLQPAAGGRLLSYSFWRRFAEIQNVVAIKIAPFNRYQTLDVIRAIVDAKRNDVALYTGNDDNILLDLLAPFRFQQDGDAIERRIVGGLLGQWAVWTRKAVELHGECRRLALSNAPIPVDLLRLANELTDANAALFDAANGYTGSIPGIHEVLRRQGFLESNVCLDPNEALSPGQCAEIDRICVAYPHLRDNDFVARHLEEWLR